MAQRRVFEKQSRESEGSSLFTGTRHSLSIHKTQENTIMATTR